jgi:hypothetical protein
VPLYRLVSNGSSTAHLSVCYQAHIRHRCIYGTLHPQCNDCGAAVHRHITILSSQNKLIRGWTRKAALLAIGEKGVKMGYTARGFAKGSNSLARASTDDRAAVSMFFICTFSLPLLALCFSFSIQDEYLRDTLIHTLHTVGRSHCVNFLLISPLLVACCRNCFHPVVWGAAAYTLSSVSSSS